MHASQWFLRAPRRSHGRDRPTDRPIERGRRLRRLRSGGVASGRRTRDGAGRHDPRALRSREQSRVSVTAHEARAGDPRDSAQDETMEERRVVIAVSPRAAPQSQALAHARADLMVRDAPTAGLRAASAVSMSVPVPVWVLVSRGVNRNRAVRCSGVRQWCGAVCARWRTRTEPHARAGLRGPMVDGRVRKDRCVRGEGRAE